MSTPHPTAAVQGLLQPIREAEIALAQAERFLAALEMRAFQDCASINVGGQVIALTVLGQDYMPKAVPGLQRLREAVIGFQRDRVVSCRSRLEGLRWQLKQATKAVCTEGQQP